MKSTFKLLSLFLAFVMIFAVFTGCDDNKVDENKADENKSDEIDDGFGGAPYKLTFYSLGDGTCEVTEILTNPNYREKFVVEIPEKSPDGDRVTFVTVKSKGEPVHATFSVFGFTGNVPKIITKEDMEQLLDKLLLHYTKDPTKTFNYYKERGGFFIGQDDNGAYAPFEVRKFFAFYTYMDINREGITEKEKEELLAAFPQCKDTPIYVLDTNMTTYERRLIGKELFNAIGYTGFEAAKAEENAQLAVSYSVTAGEYISEIRMPSSDTLVEASVYESCLNLEKVVLPKRISITEGFLAYSDISEISIPEGVEKIEAYAFAGCQSLVFVTLPSTLTYIVENAFDDTLKELQYNGTMQMWKDSVTIEGKFRAKTVHCTDGDIVYDSDGNIVQ